MKLASGVASLRTLIGADVRIKVVDVGANPIDGDPPYADLLRGGIAEVVGDAIPDPTQFDARSEYHDPKSTPAAPRWMMRRMRFVERFARVVTLDELRADAASASMMALRPGNRLSVTPVSAAEFRAACRLAKRAAAR